MAILSPSVEAIKRQNAQPTEGEWCLLNYLVKALDDTYEVFFQPYLNGDNPDIAIIRKNSGVLIIEVKDWDLSKYYIDDKTNWYVKHNNTLIKSPLKQVDSYKRNLFGLHSRDLYELSVKNSNAWATVNCAVYFHKASSSQIDTFLHSNFQSDDYRKYRKFTSYIGLLGYDSLSSHILNNLLSKFWLNKQSYYFNEALYLSCKRYLSPPIHEIEEGIQINYTTEQKELIRSEVRPRRKIKGLAGCGKTIVLAKRAVNAQKRTNSRVLILTYNLSLKNYIHDRINDIRAEFNWSNFYITNYHQFFKTEANNYNLEIQSLGAWVNVDFFEDVRENIKQYDVVFIDEIQDYNQSWIDIIVKYFTHDNTEFVVFGDEKQNIYSRELDEKREIVVRQIPAVWNRSLNNSASKQPSFRMSNNIYALALSFQLTFMAYKYNLDFDSEYAKKFKDGVQASFDFDERIIECHKLSMFEPSTICDLIYGIIKSNAIHSSDCAILHSKVDLLREIDFYIRTEINENTYTAFESSEEFLRIGREERKLEKVRRDKKNYFYLKSGLVKLSTIHSFKGWEINTLFLIIDSTDVQKESTYELIYTAITRAKQNLIIICISNNQFYDFFKKEIDSMEVF